MKFYFGLLTIAVLFAVILTTGCTGSDSTSVDSNTPTPTISENTPDVLDNSQTEITADATQAPSTDSPEYHAGMIATDNKGTLKLITVYDSETKKYTTRTLYTGNKGNQNEAYLLKEGSFKEMGTSFDNFKTFDAKYPYLYDDLNLNPDTESYYNYDTLEGNRIYIYTNGAVPNFVGYLIPDSLESMDFVNTNS